MVLTPCLSASTVITRESKQPNNRVFRGTLLFGCLISFVLHNLCLGFRIPYLFFASHWIEIILSLSQTREIFVLSRLGFPKMSQQLLKISDNFLKRSNLCRKYTKTFWWPLSIPKAIEPFKPQYPQTNSPNWSLYIFLKNELREFDKRSKYFLLGDHLINSHNLISWQRMDVVRRNLLLVTIGTYSL